MKTKFAQRFAGPARGARLRFGVFRFDTATGRLSENGKPRRLRPQSSRLLALLADRAGEIVSRDEILAKLWKDITVNSDNSIDACVRDIRRVLGDTARAPQFIKTHPREGYEFIAPVRSASCPARVYAGLAAGGLVAASAAVALFVTGAPSTMSETLLAVYRPGGSAARAPSLQSPAVTVLSEDRGLAEAVRSHLSVFPPNIIQIAPAPDQAAGPVGGNGASHVVLLQPDGDTVRIKIFVLAGPDGVHSAELLADSIEPAQIAEEILRAVHLPEAVLRELSARDPQA